jgi:hypothetical protein
MEVRMALPRRQRRLLEAIDYQMNSADPRLARLFGAFSGFCAGEPLPTREQLPRRAARFRAALWEALGAGIWPTPFVADPNLAGTVGGTDPGSGSSGAELGQVEQAPGQVRQEGRRDDRHPPVTPPGN